MRKNKKGNVLITFIFITVLTIWVVNLLVTLTWEFDNRGTFGDMFGASNALFSGLAFAGIIYTIYLQRIELTKQHKELEETKNNIKLQEFRSTYFSLLTLHQELVNSLEITDANGNNVKGRNVFRRIYEEQKQKDGSIELTEQNIDDLGHYFRDIYRIIKYVESYDKQVDDEYKYRMNKFLRSQLSSFELILICYWGLTASGGKCKPFLEKYTLFLHIPEKYKNNKELQEFYDKQAFYIKEKYLKSNIN
jgi:hypothetical protein